MKVVHIYKITNLVNSKMYFGICVNIQKRWARHKCGYGSRLLSGAFKKYGVAKFSFEHVADAFTKEDAQFLEKNFIAENGSMVPCGYNITAGGEGAWGVKISEETRQKLRDSHVGKRRTKESIEKQAAALRGRSVAPDVGAKISAAKKAAGMSPEERARCAEPLRANTHLSKTPEAIAKWKATMAERGVHPNSIAALKKHRVRVPSEKTRAIWSAQRKGRKQSPELIAKRFAVIAANRAARKAAQERGNG